MRGRVDRWEDDLDSDLRFQTVIERLSDPNQE